MPERGSFVPVRAPWVVLVVIENEESKKRLLVVRVVNISL